MRNDFESNYLEHSFKGTTWKKGAKYLKRVWKNGRWVYEYAITGKGYKKEAAKQSFNSQVEQLNAKNSNSNAGRYTALKNAERSGRKHAEAVNSYYTKSFAGITESVIKKGQNTINRLLSKFKTTTKSYVTDTHTGKTRTPSTSGETINIKELSEKNKKKKTR